MSADKPGYDDTPELPSDYRVHDCERPQPRIVSPGSAAGAPPSDAVILFDGRDLAGWTGGDGSPAGWLVEDGYMEVVPKSGNIRTKATFGDCQLHLEWAAPAEVIGESQGRGNSGVFMMGIYEIQVLDCYDNPTYADGAAGAIYGQCPPLVNACREPGAWQTYDIIWKAPRFDGDALESPAHVTVIHNGVVVHHATDLLGPTTHRTTQPYARHPPEGPLQLQDHGDRVRFRNIWCRDLREYDAR